jgi:putative nucleotidyltransferase with HDIG domain
MAKVLLVEDDEYLRDALKESLEDKRHQVFVAPNGKIARDVLGSQKFDIIVSDVQMPFLNGVDLLEWVNKNCPTPFVLMTGFTHLLEAKSAFDLGAKDFLAKPFKEQELLACLDRVLGPPPAQAESKVIHLPEYCKVNIEEFVAKPKIDFDVFVQLSPEKYIKMGHKGANLPREQLEKYKAHGIKHLFILKEDFHKLVQFNLEVSKALGKSSGISAEKKKNFIRYTGEAILEQAFITGVNQTAFDDAKNFATLTVGSATNSDECFSLLDLLSHHGDKLYGHCLAVTTYAVMLGKKLGFESPQSLFKLSMSGLFHDIGKKEIDIEILEKPRVLLTADERRFIESHPARGRDIMSSIKGVPEEVPRLIYEHHEDCAGEGYPRQVSRNEQHPMSHILQLADTFVTLALAEKVKDAHSLIDHLGVVYLNRIDPTGLKALRSLFPK